MKKWLHSILTSLLCLAVPEWSDSKGLDSDIDIPVRTTARSVIGPVAQFRIANHYVAPDGHNRSATLVNGELPGPLLRANKSDEFRVEVVNELTEYRMPLETSVHFHGIFQHKSNWADGVSYVTQCPLRQQESFVQKFNATNQTGTYWYHSHYSTQYCDGLRGPLVIYDPDDPHADLYDVDDENTVITLSDWYHLTSLVLGQLTRGVDPNSTLINGKGRYAEGPQSDLSVVGVTEGLRYRFRLVATSCRSGFNFSIDSHSMTIIEVDGTEIYPVEVDSITVYAAQRYSVVVTANQTVGNYWIRALPLDDTPLSNFDNNQNMAILRYDGAEDEDPTTDAGPYDLPFDESSLHPLYDAAAPGEHELGKADVNLILAPGSTDDGHFTLGDASWANPTVPVLLQILSGARDASDLLPSGSIYTLPPYKVVEISFPGPNNAPGAPHPLHLHGHNFAVIRVAGSDEVNFLDPVRRDVVSIGSSATDNVTIRFRTNNPGPWFLHCHIDWHLNHGFAVVMAEAPNVTAYQQSKVIPDDWSELCSSDLDWGQTRLGLLGH